MPTPTPPNSDDVSDQTIRSRSRPLVSAARAGSTPKISASMRGRPSSYLGEEAWLRPAGPGRAEVRVRRAPPPPWPYALCEIEFPSTLGLERQSGGWPESSAHGARAPSPIPGESPGRAAPICLDTLDAPRIAIIGRAIPGSYWEPGPQPNPRQLLAAPHSESLIIP